MSNVEYRTVKNESVFEYTEKKSVFIAVVSSIRTEDEARSFLAGLRKQHPDARHVCFAYVLPDGMTVRYGDDGEPQGTAGLPILDVIKKKNLRGVVVAVVRYFGGVLLGAPGLLRAYSSAAVGVLSDCDVVVFCSVTHMRCELSYGDAERFTVFQKNQPISEPKREYATSVKLDFKIRSKDVDAFQIALHDYFDGKVAAMELSTDTEIFEEKI